MRHDPLYYLWAIHCPCREDCHGLRQWLPLQVRPEATFVDEVRPSPAGIETGRREAHRLGDYFESIEVLPGSPQTPTSFRLLFRRLPDAGRFWKDLMVRILQGVRARAAQTTTTLEYQGDAEPEVLAADG